MRVKLLIATQDIMYTGLTSEYISEKYIDTIEVSVCNTSECMQEMLLTHRYDVALIDAKLFKDAETESIHLPMLLWSEHETDDASDKFIRIRKHQRISSIVAEVLEQCSKVSGNKRSRSSGKTNITAVWSPIGGVGKTTVALAYCAFYANEGKDVFYLSLESFSSIPVFFSGRGKSISTVFEMLDSNEGNVKMLVQGICCQENGITYLCCPDNYDDINVLTAANISELVTSCAEITDELVIDLSCVCDLRTKRIFELANRVLLVTEPSSFSQTKLSQFTTQNDVFESIKEKTTLIANKAAKIHDHVTDSLISLPLVEAADARAVLNTLKDNDFSF
jgi:MinD-like ATPase involved in chromosome partitioning or flagellar assembly